jgi:hypothetical protein
MAELHQPHAGHDATSNAEVHHEQSDVNIRGIFAFAAVLLVSAVVIHVAVWVLFRYFDTRLGRERTPQFPLAIAQENRLPPEPRLQVNPRQDLADLREKEQQTLDTYGWVDRNAGVVRIPIDEAIKFTLQRGLPARASEHGDERSR